MYHPIHKITAVIPQQPYRISVRVDDGSEKTIDLEPILYGEMYGMLRDRQLFEQVHVDQETGTVQWPCGADLDPALLFAWDEHIEELTRRAREWSAA